MSENGFNRVFSEIFEEPKVDLNRIRPCEQLILLTISLGRVIEQLEPAERDVFSYRLGLIGDGGAQSASDVATLMDMDIQVVDTHYAEGLRKVRTHPDVQGMKSLIRQAVVM